MISTTSNAFQKLKDRARRRRFIANQIKNGFAFQVRALRKDRVLTQQELASEAETTQAVISRIEKNGAGNFNVKTLQKIADAFDVALVVRLEPINRLLDWVDDLSPEAMSPRRSETILAEMEDRASREIARVSTSTGSRINFRVLGTERTTFHQSQLPFMYFQPREVVKTETVKETTSPELSQPTAA